VWQWVLVREQAAELGRARLALSHETELVLHERMADDDDVVQG